MSRKRLSRTRRFGEVTVTGAADRPEGVGSRVIHGNDVYELPHYPSRYKKIETMEHGLAVSFNDGGTRLLDPRFDAVVSESAAPPELTAGDVGRLRYIARCGTLPELEPTEATWFEAQAAAVAKWGTPTSDRLVEAIVDTADERLTAGAPAMGTTRIAALAEAAGQASGVTPAVVLARILHPVTPADLAEVKALTEAEAATAAVIVRSTGERSVPVCSPGTARVALLRCNSALTEAERGRVYDACDEWLVLDAGEGEALWEAIYAEDVALSNACLSETVAEIAVAQRGRDVTAYGPLVERWLALHGDAGRVREDSASLERALTRAASLAADPEERPRLRSPVEGRVVGAQRGVYAEADRMEGQIAESRVRTVTSADVWGETPAAPSVIADDPLAREAAKPRSVLREARAEAASPTHDDALLELAARPVEELQDRAYELYLAQDGATVDGRRRIAESSGIQLAEIITELSEAAAPDVPDAGSLIEAEIKDTTEDTRLDAMLANSGESLRRFKASLARRTAAGDDSRRPVSISDSDAPTRAMEAALAAGRAALRG